MKRGKNQLLVYIALLVAQGAVISLLERMIPSPFIFAPGAKLGLANVITLLALFTLPTRQSFQVVALRVLVTLLLGGTFSMFLYSATGAFLSYVMMLLVKHLGPKRVSVIGISIFGGMMFNVGQLAVAAWLSQSWQIFNYLPWLSFAGILAGASVGVVAYYLLNHNQALRQYHEALVSLGEMDWLTP